MMGPVDYVVIGFKGSNFDGKILDKVVDATQKNIIRVLDLVFIIKDEFGSITEGEYVDQSDELKETFGDFSLDDDTPLLSDEDITKIGAQMENDTAAGVLVIEHLWARELKQAIADKGGFLIADGRIHPEAAEAAMKELQTA
jgi:hypothetical protein